MKKYESYKPLSELWLSSIPSHWNSRKIKYLFSERSEKGYPDEPLLVASQSMGVVPKHVYGNRTVEAMKDLHLLKLVRVGDFVISLRSFQGGIEYAYYQGIISPAYTIMIPKDMIVPHYFRYLAKSRLFIELLQLCVTGIREGQNIDYNKLKNHQIPVPPRDEQEQIVRYLDWQVSKINKLITVKKKQITLLNEQKEAIIYNTVTKGLDPNVPMKNSRIEWVNTLPIAWNKDKVVRLFKRIGSGTTPSSGNLIYYNDGTIPWINSGDLYSDSMYLDGTERAVSQKAIDDYSILKIYPANTIVIAMYGASIGNLAISRIRACCNQACCCLSEIDNRLDIIYAYYLFKACKSYWIKKSQGGGQPNISQDIIKQTWLPLPPRAEQFKITHFLCEYESSINKTIDNIQFEIRLLQELRIRLISDVATGQIDVRGIEIPEYEYVEEESDEQSDDEIDGNPYSEEVSDELEME
ncbi:MAG TPA: restriction endonuclease subunit S [Bacillota bacterium]|nr:restriction endonuclease subunit S [Bacillota bacterium]